MAVLLIIQKLENHFNQTKALQNQWFCKAFQTFFELII